MADENEDKRARGFYWVTEHGCNPTIAYYRQGVWTFSGCPTLSLDSHVKVLSPRLVIGEQF